MEDIQNAEEFQEKEHTEKDEQIISAEFLLRDDDTQNKRDQTNTTQDASQK